ncbi:MAG: hypothetical protein SCALA702_26800 [Melioribacteraceae bacterium]|nr:MAG: hypothetical protein SCALA702_26800 [Melioribacteraceae bacterium]
MAEINGIKVPFRPLITDDQISSRRIPDFQRSFESVFKDELEKLKFSNHAQKRLESRNIKFNDTEMNKIYAAVDKAELKGAKDSLILMNETALIVNIPNRTVVTAMPVEEQAENVFTNIDSVVITK